VFVADPVGTAEEDGFVVTFAYDASTESSSFVVLDARHLAGEPVAVVRLPRRVPVGIHGSWIPV
jgi:carotenoid cleavage dioxygenase